MLAFPAYSQEKQPENPDMKELHGFFFNLGLPTMTPIPIPSYGVSYKYQMLTRTLVGLKISTNIFPVVGNIDATSMYCMPLYTVEFLFEKSMSHSNWNFGVALGFRQLIGNQGVINPQAPVKENVSDGSYNLNLKQIFLKPYLGYRVEENVTIEIGYFFPLKVWQGIETKIDRTSVPENMSGSFKNQLDHGKNSFNEKINNWIRYYFNFYASAAIKF